MKNTITTGSFYCIIKRKRLFYYTQEKTFLIRGREYKVPAYYQFDGATVPRLLWVLFSSVGVAFPAASLHDFLYDTVGRGLNGEYNLSRSKVDNVFYLHMLQDKTPKLQALMMYYAVRLFGWSYWKKYSYPDYLVNA